ncbi:MAG: hypothetical protein ACO3F5_01500, partial [Gemmatimonadaceae bacterium]
MTDGTPKSTIAGETPTAQWLAGAASRGRAAVGRAVIVGRATDVPRALEHPAVAPGRSLAIAGVV